MPRTLHVNDLITAYAVPPMNLGEGVYDDEGDSWRLVKGREDFVFGEVTRNALELLNGTFTTAAALNTNALIDSAAFASITADDLIGARGNTIGSLATGGGQQFIVVDRISDDELLIRVTSWTSSAGVGLWSTDGLWEVANTVSSTYTISLPGHVEDAVEGFPATGVVLITGGVDVSALPYFYIKQSGIAPCMADDSDNSILDGEDVYVAAGVNGFIQGPNATGTPTNSELVGRVGIALGGEIAFDSLVNVDLNLAKIATRSHKFTRRVHPMNAVTI